MRLGRFLEIPIFGLVSCLLIAHGFETTSPEKPLVSTKEYTLDLVSKADAQDHNTIHLKLLPTAQNISLNAYAVLEKKMTEAGVDLSKISNAELKSQFEAQIEEAATLYTDLIEAAARCAETVATVQKPECPAELMVPEKLLRLEEHDFDALAPLRIRQFFAIEIHENETTKEITTSANDHLLKLGISKIECKIYKQGWIPAPACSLTLVNEQQQSVDHATIK